MLLLLQQQLLLLPLQLLPLLLQLLQLLLNLPKTVGGPGRGGDLAPAPGGRRICSSGVYLPNPPLFLRRVSTRVNPNSGSL